MPSSVYSSSLRTDFSLKLKQTSPLRKKIARVALGILIISAAAATIYAFPFTALPIGTALLVALLVLRIKKRKPPASIEVPPAKIKAEVALKECADKGTLTFLDFSDRSTICSIVKRDESYRGKFREAFLQLGYYEMQWYPGIKALLKVTNDDITSVLVKDANHLSVRAFIEKHSEKALNETIKKILKARVPNEIADINTFEDLESRYLHRILDKEDPLIEKLVLECLKYDVCNPSVGDFIPERLKSAVTQAKEQVKEAEKLYDKEFGEAEEIYNRLEFPERQALRNHLLRICREEIEGCDDGLPEGIMRTLIKDPLFLGFDLERKDLDEPRRIAYETFKQKIAEPKRQKECAQAEALERLTKQKEEIQADFISAHRL